MYRLTYQDGDTPRTHDFSSGEVVIGRSPDCQIVLRDFGISRNHAKVVVGEDGLARILLHLQEKDGSWWDYPLYDYHQQYGTAFALMTLVRCRHDQPAR